MVLQADIVTRPMRTATFVQGGTHVDSRLRDPTIVITLLLHQTWLYSDIAIWEEDVSIWNARVVERRDTLRLHYHIWVFVLSHGGHWAVKDGVPRNVKYSVWNVDALDPSTYPSTTDMVNAFNDRKGAGRPCPAFYYGGYSQGWPGSALSVQRFRSRIQAQYAAPEWHWVGFTFDSPAWLRGRWLRAAARLLYW